MTKNRLYAFAGDRTVTAFLTVLTECCPAHAVTLFSVSGADYELLSDAVERLTLNDASVAVRKETSAALGAGFRCGCVLCYFMVLSYRHCAVRAAQPKILCSPRRILLEKLFMWVLGSELEDCAV